SLGDGSCVVFDQSASSGEDLLALAQVDATHWRVRSPLGREWLYDFSCSRSRGRLSRLRDEMGREWTVNYSSRGILSSLVESGGRSMRFIDDDADDLIDRIEDHPGQTHHRLAYQQRRLTSVDDQRGAAIAVSYLSSGRLQWLQEGIGDDGNPNRWSYGYTE